MGAGVCVWRSALPPLNVHHCVLNGMVLFLVKSFPIVGFVLTRYVTVKLAL